MLGLIFVSGGVGAPAAAVGGTYNAAEYFASGPVTITLYDQEATGVGTVALDSDVCTEHGSSGMWVWDIANITTLPNPYKEYTYSMTDGVTTSGGIIAYDDFLIQYIVSEQYKV